MASKRLVVSGMKAVGKVPARHVTPIQSKDLADGRHYVIEVYKEIQRTLPYMRHEYIHKGRVIYHSLEEMRKAVHDRFIENKDVHDPRAVDLLVHQAYNEWRNTIEHLNQSHHLEYVLFDKKEHYRPAEQKPKDFLSKFFANVD